MGHNSKESHSEWSNLWYPYVESKPNSASHIGPICYRDAGGSSAVLVFAIWTNRLEALGYPLTAVEDSSIKDSSFYVVRTETRNQGEYMSLHENLHQESEGSGYLLILFSLLNP